MILLLDNYDSFTYNLYDYILQLGADCTVKRNDEISLTEIESLNPEAIVISPGPCTPKDSGITMKVVERFVETIPLLGICLGFQAIGEFFGASLEKAEIPMHGKTSELFHDDEIFENIPQKIKVMRYHSLILKNLDDTPLKVIATTDETIPMAIRHSSLPIYGFQFHPESILTEYGIEMMRNWLQIISPKQAA